MKRFAFYAVFFIIILSGIAGAATLIQNSKHDLSYNSTSATIKASSSGATEICVFCHTPHNSRMDAPLWNKTAVSGPYTAYASDVLTELSYPPIDLPTTATAPVDVHIKTRICLSCHDGTIALGQLANLPQGFSGVQLLMSGTAGANPDYAMPPSASGYLGTDLRDDHPVAVKYMGSSGDPELNDVMGGNVRGYNSMNGDKTSSAGNTIYVECTSCHNAHDNQYGNFLVGPNDGSKICINCHNKNIGTSTGSAHDLATTATYSPPTGGTTPPTVIGNNVSEVKCMICHFPHKAGISDTSQLPRANPNEAYGKYLLTFKEEQSCFNRPDRWNRNTSPCHGNNAESVSNIQSLVDAAKTSRHQVDKNLTPLHDASEARSPGWLGAGSAKWHVECADCHNPHTAGDTVHTQNPPVPSPSPIPILSPSSPLYGAAGVQVNSAPGWGGVPQGSYTFLEPVGVVDIAKSATGARYEYQICLRCHSDYGWQGTGSIPDSPSLGGDMTDQATEFNSGNPAFHPVQGPNAGNQGSYVGLWTSGNQTMFCSDCHNSNVGGPQGPHGSNNSFILVAPFSDAPSTASGGVEQNSGDLCFLCHDPNVYLTPSNTATGGTGFTMNVTNYNLHARHAWLVTNTSVPSPWGYKCVDCHIRIPHGWKRKAMIILQGEGVANGSTFYESGARITSPEPTLNTGAYVKTDCTTVNGCHQ